jgi:hypothetical protein
MARTGSNNIQAKLVGMSCPYLFLFLMKWKTKDIIDRLL